jgi:hypothetical protein
VRPKGRCAWQRQAAQRSFRTQGLQLHVLPESSERITTRSKAVRQSARPLLVAGIPFLRRQVAVLMPARSTIVRVSNAHEDTVMHASHTAGRSTSSVTGPRYHPIMNVVALVLALGFARFNAARLLDIGLPDFASPEVLFPASVIGHARAAPSGAAAPVHC